MKNGKSRLLSLLLVGVILLGLVPYTALAKNVEDQNIVAIGTQSENKYLGYMSQTHKAEHELRLNKLYLTNYWLSDDNGQSRYIIFCFNENLSAPNHTMYLKKFEDGTEDEFVSLAHDPIKGKFNYTYVKNSVLWATYLGYPGNQARINGQSLVDRAIDFYNIPDEYAEDAVRLATQMAVWLFTDYHTALKKFWSPILPGGILGIGEWGRIKVCDHYDPKKMGDPITYLAADIARMAWDKSNWAPDGMEVDLYIPKSKENQGRKQNVLVTHYEKMDVARNPVEVELNVYKEMEDQRPVKDGEFSFHFTGTTGQKEYDELCQTVEGGKVKIPKLTFQEPGTYRFFVEEMEGNDPGVEYQKGKFQITVTVTGTRDLQARVSYEDQGEDRLVVTNKVKAPQFGELQIVKDVTGEGAEPDRKFDFTVTLTGADGKPFDGTIDGYNFKNGTTAVQASQKEPVTIHQIPEGMAYVVKEVALGQDSAYELASKNDLAGTITAGNVAKAAFLNRAKPKPLYGDLVISKTVKDVPEDHREDSFSFTVTLEDLKADVTQVTGAQFTNGVAHLTLTAGESRVIKGLPAGTGYTVLEETPEGYAMDAKGATGRIVANQQQNAEFVNTYLKTGELTIQKVIEGAAASDQDVFTFRVTLIKGDELLQETACKVKDQTGAIKQVPIKNGVLEVSVTGSGYVTLMDLPVGVSCHIDERQADGSFTSTEGNPVEHGYELADVRGNDQVTAANQARKVVFTNEAKTETGYLQIFKTVEGSHSSIEDEFGFRITLRTPDGKPLSGTFQNQDGEGIAFDTKGTAVIPTCGGNTNMPRFVKIYGIPVGTRYTVEEFTGTPDEYTAVPGSFVKDGYILKSVEGDTAGTIVKGKNPMAFVNRKADTALTIRKTIAGNFWTDDQFTFVITLDGTGANFSGQRDGIAFQNGQAEVTIQGAGTKTITGLPECGYTVTEKPAKGWTVPEPQSGTLTDGTAAIAAFENVRTPAEAIAVSLQAHKTLDGKVPEEDQFTFVLKDSSGTVLDIQSNREDGSVLFAPLSIGRAGDYRYEISEESGMTPWIVYDQSVYTAVVHVVEDQQTGTLQAEVTYQKDGADVSAAVFANTTVTTSVTAKKVWKLDDGGQAADFVTAVLCKDGVPYDTAELNEQNGWSHTWENLHMDAEWTVEEQNVPQGFRATVEQEGNIFTLVNDDLPVVPDKPVEPNIPDRPTEPEVPEQPTEPEVPEQPSEPTIPDRPAPEGPSDVPQTGDFSSISMWWTIGLFSLAGAVWVLLSRKRTWKRK